MRYLRVVIFTLFVHVFAYTYTLATPAITAISGTGTDGSSLTITGTAFGTKGVAAPMKFDKFESGTLGSDVGNGWTKDAASNCSAPIHYPKYSNTILRTNSTKSVKCFFDEATDPGCAGDGAHYSSSFGIANVPAPGLPTIYMDGWVYYNPASPESRNVKLVRIHTNYNGSPNLFVNIYCPNNGDGLRVDQAVGTSAKVYDDCNLHACPFAEPWHGESWWANNWRHLQLYLVQSGPALNNGKIQMRTDGILDPNATNWNNRSTTTFWNTVFFGNYVGHDGDGSQAICPSASPGNTYIYWDDAYVDSTHAHVEIGNAATYAACTHTEIQPATAWTATSVTVTTNRGTFSTVEGNWLYVMDRDGMVNATGFKLAAVISSTFSYFVPQAGPLSSPSTLEGPQAIAYAVTCPNNDLLTNGARLKVVLADDTGAPMVGVAATSIYAQFNGGTAAQGFTGAGDDSIYANSTYAPLTHCPDVRFIYADNATDATGTAYIYWKGRAGVRDMNRKWGMYAGDIPIFALGTQLSGRITTLSANGTYTAHVKNIDTEGAITTNAGEIVNALDLNPVTAAIGGAYVYNYDFNNDGVVDDADVQVTRNHFQHRCNYPQP